MSRRLGTLAGPAAGAWLAAASLLFAQGTTGRIVGVVTDGSGGSLSGATVTVSGPRTGLVRTDTTDGRGAYTVVDLPPGDYSVTVEFALFRTHVTTGCRLTADARLTVDIGLERGAPGEMIRTAAPAGRIDTTSGEIVHTLDRPEVETLALNGRHSLELVPRLPGTVQPTTDAIERMTAGLVDTSVNGGRTNTNLVTLDGGFNLDAGSNNSQISTLGVDFVDHLRVSASNGSAEYGRQSGATITFVTRAGTNRFTGTAFEYLRRGGLDANDYFANLRGIEKRSPVFDNFGFTLGGPLVRGRVFFFGGTEWKRIRRPAHPTTRSIPTSAMRRGDFGALPVHLENPDTGQPFPNNVIPSSLITADGRAIANVYGAMAAQAAWYDDSEAADNAVFQEASPFDFRQELARLDVRAGTGHRLTSRLVFDHDSLIAPFGSSINSPLPTIRTERHRPARSIQLVHAWSGRPRLVNEVVVNVAGHGQDIRPVGDAWRRDTYGFAFPQIYGGGRYEQSIPDVNVGGFAGFRGASGTLSSPTADYSLSDTITWRAGAHTWKGGGVVAQNRKDQNGRSAYAGLVSFSTSSATTTGHAFADALLGNFRRYEEAQVDPSGSFRSRGVEAFLSDSWRVTRRLSIDAGVRYSWQVPTVALANNTTSFDPLRYQASDAVVVQTNGTILVGTGNRFNGLTRPGDVPAAYVDDVPNATSPFVRRIPVARSRGYYRSEHLLAPRVSLAWSPGRGSLVVRAAAGLFHDRPEGSLQASLPNNPPFVMSAAYENGNLSAPSGGRPAALVPWGTIESIDPNLQAARVWKWNLGVERQLPWRATFAEVAYVASRGAHLLRQPDINAPAFEDLTRNIALKYSTNYWRPYKGYSAIKMFVSNGRSDYQGLQLSVRRQSGSAHFAVSYTLSQSNDTASSNTESLDPGAPDQAYDYGPSAHNRRHVLVATWACQLPSPATGPVPWRVLLGGWQVAGTYRYQSGAPFTVTGRTAIGTRRADYLGGNPYRFSVDQVGGVVSWLDPTRFAPAPDTRPGNSRRNAFVGPPYQGWDLSVRKALPLRGRVGLQFEADFFNAFNQVRFNNPASSLTGTTPFGTVTSAGPPRQVQLGVRVSF